MAPPGVVQRIGLYRPGGLGDLLLLAPTLRAIRQRYPTAWVHLWGPSEAGFCLQYLGLADSSDSHQAGLRLPCALDTFIGWEWDDGRERLALLAAAHGIERVALSTAWAPAGLHQSRHLGATAQQVLDLPASSHDEAPLALPPFRPLDPSGLVLLHMGGSFAGKRWPRARFADLAAQLLAEGQPVAQLVTRDGHAALAGIPQYARPLLGVLWLLATCRLLICNDTGIAHLAALVGAPSVVLFGPAQTITWRPLGTAATILQTCQRMRATDAPIFCPAHDCFADLSVELVLAAARARLAVQQTRAA